MNLQHMKYAVAVAETGSINKAADRLFVASPISAGPSRSWKTAWVLLSLSAAPTGWS